MVAQAAARRMAALKAPGVLAKSASGALEHVPLCPVVNLARAMEALEDMGYRRVGLEPFNLGPDQLAQQLNNDRARYASSVKSANIKLD